jgi:hypothetical protein
VRKAALVVIGGHEAAEYTYGPTENGRRLGRKRTPVGQKRA